ncbi:MAG: FAD-binding oxidoreductase [Bdellovibrionales bacterium]|nr:FAD-binding oxidoreductase [Bdellovibrionales bacterium]
MDIKALFQSVLSDSQISTDPEELATYGKDWLALYEPQASAVLFPHDTQQVSDIIKCACTNNIALVPSGGRTGLSGGATALAGEVILSLERMNKIFEVNLLDQALHCQAGVPTEKVKQAALEHDLCYPISFGSIGSSHIGGNVATNAGGIHVIRYGNTRAWVLGLTAVTGTGEILKLNGSLYKDRTGYDLHQLLIGSEGTLAVITEVILKLAKRPEPQITALCGVHSIDAALELLQAIRLRFQGLSAFEYLERNGLEKVLKSTNTPDPFPEAFPIYLVIEIEEISSDTRDKLEEFLADFMEQGTLAYVVMSQNTKQSKELMNLREVLPEVLARHHILYKNDLSVPIRALQAFMDELKLMIPNLFASAEVVLFGHLGDGNIHVNILKPDDMPLSEFKALCSQHETAIFERVRSHQGSISAEHGVGLLKKDHLGYSRTPTELSLMKQIKQIFDPQRILNPGKIFD